MTSTVREPMHGYDLDDLDSAARHAVSMNRFMAADRQDLYMAAWDGIIDLLCAEVTKPSSRDLIRAGDHGIARYRNEYNRHHGWSRTHGLGGTPSFRVFWRHNGDWPSRIEDTVVEQIANTQILNALRVNEVQALSARAAADSIEAAAALCGWSTSYLKILVASGRRRYLMMWHAPETAPRTYRKQPIRKESPHAPCGTRNGYERHRYRRERPCDDCRRASAEYKRDRRAAA